MVQVVSKLVEPDHIKWSGGAPHHFKPSPGIWLSVLVLTLVTVDL